MGVVAIARSHKSKKILLIAFSISLTLGLGLSLPDAAWADNNATLSKLEKWLFFATFTGQSDEDRIKRIEEKTFGEPAEGSVDERLKKLDEILTQRQKEKDESAAAEQSSSSSAASSTGSTAGGASSSGTAPDAAHNFGGSADAGHNFGSSPTQAGQTPVHEDPEAAKERQRIAVQAAREQEMHDLLQDGAKLWRSRHGPEAVDKFEQVLRLDPQNPDAHFSIGVIQESTGQFKEARTHYLAAAQSSPDNKDYQDAVNAVTRRLQAPPAPADPNHALTEKANAAFKRGEYISAINLYKELEEKSPKQASVKFSLGTTYLMMKDHFNALEYFKLAHQLEPNNVKYTNAFNDLSTEMAKHEAAQQGIENAYQQGGGSPQGGSQPLPEKSSKGKKGKRAQQQQQQQQQFAPVNQAAMGGVANMQQQQPFSAYPGQGSSQIPGQQMMQAPQMQQQMMMPPQQQMPMQQRPMQQAYPGGGGQFQPYRQPTSYVQPMMNNNQGTYIPPDPQAYASPHVGPLTKNQMQQQMQQQMPQPMQQQMPQMQQQMPQQMPQQMQQQMPQQMQQQMPQQMQQQMPQQMQQQMPQQMQQQMPQQMQQQMPQQMQQQMPQQMQQQMPQMQQQMPQQMQQGGQSYSGGMQNQYGGGGQMGYSSPPQPAPTGHYDPRLAQQLNTPNGGVMHSKNEPMEESGISGHGSDEGIKVTAIKGGSRAAKAGLRKGDIIRTVDGNEVMQPAQLNQVLSQYNQSQTIPLLIFRDGNITPIQF